MSLFETGNLYTKRLSYGYLAHGLGITERHVKRLIARSTAFREAVGAYRPKGCMNRRIDMPEIMPYGLTVLIERARRSVPSLQKRAQSPRVTRVILGQLGFGNLERERQLRELQWAMMLKRFDSGKPLTKKWLGDIEEVLFLSRVASKKQGCSVHRVPKYLKRYFDQENAENAETNTRRMAFQSPLKIRSQAEIRGIIKCVNGLWPDDNYRKRSGADLKSVWFPVQLQRAVKEFKRQNKPISWLNAENLRGYIYRNPAAEAGNRIGITLRTYERYCKRSDKVRAVKKAGFDIRTVLPSSQGPSSGESSPDSNSMLTDEMVELLIQRAVKADDKEAAKIIDLLQGRAEEAREAGILTACHELECAIEEIREMRKPK
jgi:hypothetical protein